MDRRDFVKAGLLAGVAAGATGAGCGPRRGAFTRPDPALPMPANMDDFLAKFDITSMALAQRERLQPLVPAGARRGMTAAAEKTLERYTRSLYVSGTFLDLPTEAQYHPGMQQRMVDYYPELNATVEELTTSLSSMSDSERRQAQQVLRDNKDLPMHIAEELNKLGESVGMSRRRRLQIRSGMMQTGFRMRTQSTSTVIDEYVERMHRLAPPDADQAAMQERILSLVGDDFLWQGGPLSQAPGVPGPAPAPYGPPQPMYSTAPVTPRGNPGVGILKGGGLCLGLGAITLGGGYLILQAGSLVGAFAMTAGVLGVLGGIVLLIVGASIKAARG